MVYAGGIVVLYVFSILLTSGEGDRAEKAKRSKAPGRAHYHDCRFSNYPDYHVET